MCRRILHVLDWPVRRLLDLLLGPPVKPEEAYWDG